MSLEISPWLLPMPFVALALLVGCSAKLDVVSKPNEPATVAVPWAGGKSTSSMDVSEVCYDGILYLVNIKGGMTHKIDPQRLSFGGAIHCPTKELT